MGKIKKEQNKHYFKKGIVVASNAKTEWLLPWWWEGYASHNDLPVFFVDLGMSSESVAWCRERGIVVSLFEENICEEENLCSSWEKAYGTSYRIARRAWFQKPQACLLSPFDQTIWIDLDCEVLGDVGGAFSFLLPGKEIAVCEDVASFEERKGVYNTGFFVFTRNSSIIQEWNQVCRTEAEKYWGDDRALSSLLSKYGEQWGELPSIYNWRISQGVPFGAKVIHWCGEWGKAYIAKCGGLRSSLEHNLILKSFFS